MMLIPLSVMAQGHELGLWTSVGVDKKFGKKWEIGADAEYRMRDKISTTDRASIGVSASYKASKWLKASAGYEYLHTRQEGSYSSSGKYYNSTYWYPRHRIQLSLTGSWKLSKRIKLSLRERWQYTYRASFEQNRINVNEFSKNFKEVSQKRINGKSKNMLRSKLSISYNIPKCKFEQFTSVELYSGMANGDDCFGVTEKLRYSLGTEYKIDKKNSVEAYYIYQDYKTNDIDEEEGAHIIGIGYNHSF